MGKPKRVYPPLTPEQLALCPYGDPKCRICQLRPDQITDIHNKKFKEKYTYKTIREYIKATYNMGEDYTRLGNHFKNHVFGKEALKQALSKKADMVYPELVQAVESISKELKITTNTDLEKAYESLVKMAHTFVGRVNRIQDKISEEIDKRDKSGELDNELKNVSALDMLEKLSSLNKEARAFVKEISALRAPKVMVAQFLESFIDSVIKDVSMLVGQIASELKHSVDTELEEAGHAGVLSDQSYATVFRHLAVEYKDRMISLKREKMSDAVSSLQDMEKII